MCHDQYHVIVPGSLSPRSWGHQKLLVKVIGNGGTKFMLSAGYSLYGLAYESGQNMGNN